MHPGSRYVAPVVFGAIAVSYEQREREVPVLGTTHQMQQVRKLSLARGRFLPDSDIRHGAPVCVLGHKLKIELFGSRPAVGVKVRIGADRFRVIGVLSEKGESVGLDMSDVVIVHAASAMALFDTSSLFRVLIETQDRDDLQRVKKSVLRILKDRHEGEDDVTVITQDAILATFDRIFTALTLTVTGIGAISIAVAGILIMNVMLIAVSQRREEVGLLKAIGAPIGQIITLFMAEAALLSLAGAVLGILLALGSNRLIGYLLPKFPITMPLWSLGLALAVAFSVGLVFGVLPAMRAARLDPVESLSRR